MKVTANWVTLHFPFLSVLLEQGKVDGRKKLILKIKTGPVEIHPPFHDGVSRFTSMGKIDGASFTHFVGSNDTAANYPAEMVADGSRFEGQIVNPGCYYAILDSMASYGFRELTIFFNPNDLSKATTELKNQLSQLHLQLATTPP